MSPETNSLSPADAVGTVADLLAAARREGLRLTCDRDHFDDSGLDFRVVQAVDAAGTTWIVRTPRRADVVAAARVEARALRLVAPRLPVAVPDWQVHADDVIAYPRVAGTPAVAVEASGPRWQIVDPAAPCAAFVDSFAATLAALQAIPAELAAAAGVPTRTIAAVREGLARSFAATREALQPPEALWQRWHRWLADDELWPDHVALAHGDLHPGHLLLADDGRLVGVLDWTEAQVSDPALDLAMFHGCFGAAALARVIDRFAAAGGRTWPRLAEHAAERWAAFPAVAAEWALRTDNAAVLAYARDQLASA